MAMVQISTAAGSGQAAATDTKQPAATVTPTVQPAVQMDTSMPDVKKCGCQNKADKTDQLCKKVDVIHAALHFLLFLFIVYIIARVIKSA